jgi:predicted DNA-binding transcriptional regulator YafY
MAQGVTMNRSEVSRVYELDRLIRLGQLQSAQTAARELNVSRRSIERDLAALRHLGATLRYNRERGLYEYAGKPFTLPGQWLNEREIALLLIAERALRVFTNTSFDRDIHPAFNKLLDPIRGRRDTIDYIHALCGSVHFHRPIESTRDVRAEFSVVLDAIMDRRRLSMRYGTGRTRREDRREIEPYALVNSGGDWYVIANCRRHHDIRTFTLADVHEPRIEDHYFLMPDDFDVQKFLGQGFGRMRGASPVRVALRITPPASRWVIRSRWHASQKVREAPDGEVHLTLRCPLTDSLVRWVLQMGECVRIVAPKQLRERVAAMAGELVRNNA